ncbi:hypothetical protein AB1Y20_001526 [Prymnesium parvum]|uniref:Guanidinoacetate N-methyltransferase n=1 Tax=Prymnesium parvum TaxID=97485 RepID=A0AB34KCU2_PRYPA
MYSAPLPTTAAGSPDLQAAGGGIGAWAHSLVFTCDANGEEELLDAHGTQVMMPWERPYMVRCVDALEIDSSSAVLEVGFGCGYSAERIQRYHPRVHCIIECADVVLERLRPWAAVRPGVEVHAGTWQRVLPSLGVFDRIFFDDFGAPGLAEAEMQQCGNEAYRLRYMAARSHMHAFLDIVLEWHARPGTRVSGYLSGTPVSLERSDTRYVCQRMPVRPPAHCHYFDDTVATVPLWIKESSAPAAKDDTAAIEPLPIRESSVSGTEESPGKHPLDSPETKDAQTKRKRHDSTTSK